MGLRLFNIAIIKYLKVIDKMEKSKAAQ